MPIGGPTSWWPRVPSSSRWRFGLGALGALVGAAALAFEPASASAPAAASASATHCQPGERVQFSCAVGAKTVSLCARGEPGAVVALAYRYGLPGKVENEFVARPDNRNRFSGTVSPARPGASVAQVWFDRGDTRYLLTECTGGNCAQRAGLAVLRGERLLMTAACGRVAENDLAWFARDLVKFGADAAGSRSATELLRIEDADNDIVRIYGAAASAPH